MGSDSTARIQDLLNQCQPIEADDRIHVLLKLLNREIARLRGGLHGEEEGTHAGPSFLFELLVDVADHVVD